MRVFGAYHERRSRIDFVWPGRRWKGTKIVAPRGAFPSAGTGRSYAAPCSTSRQAMVCGSNQPPLNHARFTFAAGSSATTASHASSWWASGHAPPWKINPPGVARVERSGCGPPRHSSTAAGRKLGALKEKTASSSSSPAWVKVYSRPATGRLALSASPGSKGLQPVIRAASGSEGSASSMRAKGNWARKVAFS